jgi:hypothetical protein
LGKLLFFIKISTSPWFRLPALTKTIIFSFHSLWTPQTSRNQSLQLHVEFRVGSGSGDKSKRPARVKGERRGAIGLVIAARAPG